MWLRRSFMGVLVPRPAVSDWCVPYGPSTVRSRLWRRGVYDPFALRFTALTLCGLWPVDLRFAPVPVCRAVDPCMLVCAGAGMEQSLRRCVRVPAADPLDVRRPLLRVCVACVVLVLRVIVGYLTRRICFTLI